MQAPDPPDRSRIDELRTTATIADKAYFSTGLSAFFEMATSDAVRLLPSHLTPIEINPQRSILNVTIFHFEDGGAGPWAELMFSVVVPPVIGDWSKHPKGGFFPFLAATSSARTRERRADLLRIPHHPENIDLQLVERPGSVCARIGSGGEPVLELSVTPHVWHASTHLLHCFMMDEGQRLKADLQVTGRYTVHEQEKGSLTLHPHAMTSGLTLDEVSRYPFREHWLKDGFELFHPVEQI